MSGDPFAHRPKEPEAMDESGVRQLIERVSKIERDVEAIARRVKRLEYLRESDRRAMNTTRC
ncbi:hypothetical protein MSEO_37620 [Mycobacterium seoulense]|uniref:Uncharacterized protein n=1 Tax=Mycobacterium seoulense TaxID=386911 RepID=A0A7I7P300_9MYCO|nr:hypothetical protein MSEO_37620 [Mycobacterium seoulense]